MTPNPLIGVVYHWLGGLASGSFYVPYRGVKRWAWETFWLAGGFFSWIIAPWFFALLMTKDLLPVLHETSGIVLFWTFFFGLLWGIGGLTFGLTMRYLGLSLGMAVVLGLCAALEPSFRQFFAASSWARWSVQPPDESSCWVFSFACSVSPPRAWPGSSKNAACRPNRKGKPSRNLISRKAWASPHSQE